MLNRYLYANSLSKHSNRFAWKMTIKRNGYYFVNCFFFSQSIALYLFKRKKTVSAEYLLYNLDYAHTANTLSDCRTTKRVLYNIWYTQQHTGSKKFSPTQINYFIVDFSITIFHRLYNIWRDLAKFFASSLCYRNISVHFFLLLCYICSLHIYIV